MSAVCWCRSANLHNGDNELLLWPPEQHHSKEEQAKKEGSGKDWNTNAAGQHCLASSRAPPLLLNASKGERNKSETVATSQIGNANTFELCCLVETFSDNIMI